MDAMTILRRCREAAHDIERLAQLIAQRRGVLDGLSGPQMDPNGGGRGSQDPDKVGRIVADIDELERKKQRREEEQEVEKVAVTAMMDWLPITEGKVLYHYYVNGLSTTEIARKEKYQASYLRKVKRNGEEMLRMVNPERVDELVPGWYMRERSGRK